MKNADSPSFQPQQTGRQHSFDLRSLITDFCSWYSRAVAARDRPLTTRVSRDIPRYFRGSQVLVRHLFFKTAKSSLLYLGGGEVFLEIDVQQFAGLSYTVSCTITVTGGYTIPPAKAGELFQAARAQDRRDSFDLRSANFYFPRMVARSLGGDLRIKNRIGFSTRYRFDIRLQRLPS